MGSEFTFYDFVDGSGRNIIHDWLQRVPKGVKQKFNKRLENLEATPSGKWTHRLVDTLTDGPCDGLFEVRVRWGTRQYRILGAHTGVRGRPILLHYFIKPGARVDPAECQRAKTKMGQFSANPARHKVVHNYE